MATRSRTSTRSTTGFLKTRSRRTAGDTTTWQTQRQQRARRRKADRYAFWVKIKRVATAARQWVASTVTPGGWLLIGLATVGLGLGYTNGWVELIAAGTFAWVLLLVAALFLLSTKSLEATLSLEKDRVVVGERLTGELTVKNKGRTVSLPTQINLPIGRRLAEVAIPFLGMGGRFDQDLAIPTDRRGVIPVGPPGATRSSPIGILVRESVWGSPQDVFVYPKTVRLPSTEAGLLRDLEGDPSTRIVNDDLSFHAIREYAPGDQRRQIHWKSTAKTGRLMVRQYEETVRSEMIVALDTREEAYANEDEFELAVSAATSLALRGQTDGRHLLYVAGPETPMYGSADHVRLFDLQTRSRRTLLDDSARLRWTDRGIPLPLLAASAGSDSDGASVAIMVTGANSTWEEVRSAALRFPIDVGVLTVVCDENAEPAVTASGGITVATIALLNDLPGLLARRAGR